MSLEQRELARQLRRLQQQLAIIERDVTNPQDNLEAIVLRYILPVAVFSLCVLICALLIEGVVALAMGAVMGIFLGLIINSMSHEIKAQEIANKTATIKVAIEAASMLRNHQTYELNARPDAQAVLGSVFGFLRSQSYEGPLGERRRAPSETYLGSDGDVVSVGRGEFVGPYYNTRQTGVAVPSDTIRDRVTVSHRLGSSERGS